MSDTRMIDEPTAHRPPSDSRRRNEPRFTPGTLLGDRYRIVALLGSGGMGEVYRADDTKLGQQVALKFLPRRVGQDPSRLERLYSEVRLGRQVSHPNVCRLYDVGEWEGNHFLAMEYVDGEDLASLLRRIGKLPVQKAFDIARDICAGLAAAHGLGIIHRDLKPANIMIDGRGQARITDFGLAVMAEDLEGRGEIAGTPAYMAPEQLAGTAVSHKTDLYALGLILYEIFTGKRLFEGSDPSSRRTTARSLSSTASGELDPVIQRVVARCIEENPDARPSSIHAVIASLPGGDPLQAAIDAGETPSPQMVAAAGEVGDLSPSVAWPLLLAGILGLVAVTMLYGRTVLFRLVPNPKPPEALVDRIRTMLEASGYPQDLVDEAYWYDADEEFFRYVLEEESSLDRWKLLPRLRPGVFLLNYRQSPESLVPANEEGRIRADDPPMNVPGMTRLSVDAHGRLVSFQAIPPVRLDVATSQSKVDWSKFFEYAGGDLENLREVAPRWTAPVDNDEKRAWEGHFRGQPQTPVRIEAAAYGGKPVWFRVIGPWARGNAAAPDTVARRIVDTFFAFLDYAILIVALVVARRNVLRGRGDRRTAARLAIFVLLSYSVGYLFRVDHVADPNVEQELITRGFAYALFMAAEVWLLYLALEPYVRRRLPHTLIGWSRLFAGRWRDPMVGRDLLAGVASGTLLAMFMLLRVHAPTWFGQAPFSPIVTWTSPLVSARNLVWAWGSQQVFAMFVALQVIFLLLLGVMVLRRRPLAIAAVWLIAVAGLSRLDESVVYGLAFGILSATVFVFLLLRFGILPVAIATFTSQMLDSAPLTFDTSAWYFGRSFTILLIFAAAMAWGFWSSLGEKPVLGWVAEEG